MVFVNSKEELFFMKEATGELNMTVITVVAKAAVAAFFYAFLWPAIQQGLNRNTCKNSGGNWVEGSDCCSHTDGSTCDDNSAGSNTTT